MDTETGTKKTYAPSKVEAHIPAQDGAPTGKWVEMKSGEDLKQHFAGLDLIRYTCEKYVRIVKVRENKDAIYSKYSTLVGAKHYTIDFATSLVMKDFADNCTGWIPREASEKNSADFRQASALPSDWDTAE